LKVLDEWKIKNGEGGFPVSWNAAWRPTSDRAPARIPAAGRENAASASHITGVEGSSPPAISLRKRKPPTIDRWRASFGTGDTCEGRALLVCSGPGAELSSAIYFLNS